MMNDFVENYEILCKYIILYAALVLLLLIDPEARGGAWLVLPVSLIFPLYGLRRYQTIKKMRQSTADCTSD